MQAFVYYITYPFIIILSRAPFWFLLKVSDFLFFVIYRLIGYRKQVVLTNLRNSFPEKSEEEIRKISKDFFQFFCDLFMEVIKAFTWKEKDVFKHTKLNNPEVLEEFYKKNKSAILVVGHLGNWEWIIHCMCLNIKHIFNGIYVPLNNTYFDKLMFEMRSKFNAMMTAKKDTLRSIIKNKDKLSVVVLAADQSPSPITIAHWMQFLNQDTPVFKGPGKIAKKMDYPVIYLHFDRVKRGYYEMNLHVLCEDPKSMSEIEITEKFNRILEEHIRLRPENWLWSHKRWKHKREKA